MQDREPTANRPLGIIAAMPEEAEGLVNEMRAHPKASVAGHGGREFHVGELWGKPCVLTLARIGKVASAMTATAMIHRFEVAAIVFTGLAGGVAHHVKVGDVVIADRLMHHDLDASPLFPRYEVPLLGLSRLPTDAALSLRLEAAARDFLTHDVPELAEATRTAFRLDRPRLHRGLIASGDRFIGSTEAIGRLRTALPDTLAVEMEGAAVAQVCYEYDVPCAVVRTISDGADDAAHIDFPAFLREVASHYSYGILRRMLTA